MPLYWVGRHWVCPWRDFECIAWAASLILMSIHTHESNVLQTSPGPRLIVSDIAEHSIQCFPARALISLGTNPTFRHLCCCSSRW